MDIGQIKQSIADFRDRLKAVADKLDLPARQVELEGLQKRSIESDFWSDQRKAQSIMRRIGSITKLNETVSDLKERIEGIIKDSAEVDPSESDLVELLKDGAEVIEKRLAALELRTFLSGKYDEGDAILSLHAGQGGTEANDWVAMLLRMYTRYFNSIGWEYQIVHEVRGTETGYSTVILEVKGEYAYGYLKHEHGTHRLVRNSPFNSAGLRQTSFAGVEVMPLVDDEVDVEIRDEDIEFSAVRSSGAGGQNVNKVATSVRIVHTPSGIAVTSSNSRSQSANREAAMRLLKSKLVQIEEQKRAAAEAKLKGEHREFGWGNQIRNYVLQPYKLVKDLRTNVETSDADGILDGNIQEFIDAEVSQL